MGRLVTALFIMSVASLLTSAAHAQAATASYPGRAPIEQYRMTPAAEIALAKSAASAAIAGDADVLILGAKGYESAVKGHSGFVCLVQRSWTNDFDHPEFWNPKTRSPMCFNPAAARSVLPAYLSRTEWVLAGLSKSAMQQRSRRLVSRKGPEIGAMCYMLSRDGYLGDDVAGPWHPHLMFFLPRAAAADWGTNDAHSPVFLGDSGRVDGVVVFAVPVPRWSDGTQDSTSRQ